MDGILIIDKPPGWTSHDVVAKLRGVFRERRAGHGGTLDPMATGVLPIFFGRSTRAIELMPTGKTYLAEMRLGIVTDTQDTTGNIISENENIPDIQTVIEAAEKYLGQTTQIPPMVSAVKVNGQKLYKLARQGIAVERKPRSVTFYKIEVSPRNTRDEIKLRVECSGGTYIRTLCHDIGADLGCGAAMSGLRRVKSGPFDISQAVTVDAAANAVPLRIDSLFAECEAYKATSEQERRIRNGADFSAELPDNRYRVYSESGEFLMLGAVSEMRMCTVKSFFKV
ncbi:MAG: tRNA pseudouridine(55) synthase TruB [Oscillospiraceae bacterium]|nr:tRNA pseudouridine(55) synthase TruB [Oscillospiraceae bacterium]